MRGLRPGSRGQVAAMLSAMAHAGPAVLFSVASCFLTDDFLRLDELDRLSDPNLAAVSLAVQQCAPEVLDDWHKVLCVLDAA